MQPALRILCFIPAFLCVSLTTAHAALSPQQQIQTSLTHDSVQLGRFCSFQIANNTPSLLVHYPERAECRSIRCERQLEKLTAVELRIAYFKSSLKYEWRYKNGRESRIGEHLARLILPQRQYPGNLLVDEYIQGIPMEWVFDTVDQLKKVIKLLSEQYTQHSINPCAVPLYIVINYSTDLNRLSDEECSFLTNYFDVIPHNDPRVSTLFNARREKILTQYNQFESGRTDFIHSDGLIAAAWITIEKTWKRFEARKIVPAIAAIIALDLVYEVYRRHRDQVLNRYVGR